MNEWISVKDRLPPKDIPVLCFYYDKYIDVMEYWHDTEEGKPEFYNPPSFPVEDVTHWMPLPLPPEGGKVDMNNWISCKEKKPNVDEIVELKIDFQDSEIIWRGLIWSSPNVNFVNFPHATHWRYYNKECDFCKKPDSIISKETCCTGCSKLNNKKD